MGQTHSELGGTTFGALSRFSPVATATSAVGITLVIVLETVQLDLEDALALGRGRRRQAEDGGRTGHG